ncbi:3-oxo-tetronate kinase [Photorhabdus heterorhabditis]|uniref:3-oxo-tetronate kinase n=1 Tax=Photorhabdus heterorhabditis TaxID=880156 RepID=UPI001561BF0E|nr:3-oxo-tetronate kinase [Photorhabdus heterorhabditis]NRN27567.1 four-carbon acid sugar kinase family protein [Photorhabdus heterorhabditis subsp. aluminescens]
MTIKLGVIADDFTGATDIASFMVQSGWRVVQLLVAPDENTVVPQNIDAIVISLKSRSCPVDEAVNNSLKSCRWLRQKAGCQRIFFKYCSTFDSTSKGNIGPVTDALMGELNADITLICPALPVNGRTVVHGHLFVNGQLVNKSGMQHHPITPMKDANLIRLMEQQAQGKTGLVDLTCVHQGEQAIRKQLNNLQQQGIRYAVVDAMSMNDLLPIASAVSELTLVTGGSGLGAALASTNTGKLLSPPQPEGATPPAQNRRTVILSGSCSVMTNKQVAQYQKLAPAKSLDIDLCIHDPQYAGQLVEWIMQQSENNLAPMLYSTQLPETLQKIQQQYGATTASEAIENTFASVVKSLQQRGFNTFIIAGGETAGKIVQSLDIQQFSIGAPIAPGVPWVHDLQHNHWLALKSGNFGDINFFLHAQEMFHE